MKKLFLMTIFTLLFSCSIHKKTNNIYQKECTAGNFLSCFELGKQVNNKNPELAKVYFEKACRLGHETSCDYHLTSFMKKNKIKDSVNYYQRECRTNNSYSCTVLGRIYFNLGNKDKALEYYKSACESGEPGACAFISITKHKSEKTEEELVFMSRACSLGLSKNGEAKTPVYCVLAGSVYARAQKLDFAGKYYRSACVFKEYNKETLLYKMLGCSRAGIYIKKNSQDMYDLGTGYLKSKCFSSNEKYGYKDCYDVATGYSLKKNPGESLRFLEYALKKGYNDWSYILQDHELRFMRKTLAFKKLINRFYRLSQKIKSTK